MSIGLTPRGSDDLEYLARTTGMKANDIISRALQLYARCEREIAEGGEFQFRRADGEVQSVWLL